MEWSPKCPAENKTSLPVELAPLKLHVNLTRARLRVKLMSPVLKMAHFARLAIIGNPPPAFNRPDRSGRRVAQAEQVLLAADIDSARLERGAGHALLTQLGFAHPLAFLLRRLDDVHLAGFVE